MTLVIVALAYLLRSVHWVGVVVLPVVLPVVTLAAVAVSASRARRR